MLFDERHACCYEPGGCCIDDTKTRASHNSLVSSHTVRPSQELQTRPPPPPPPPLPNIQRTYFRATRHHLRSRFSSTMSYVCHIAAVRAACMTANQCPVARRARRRALCSAGCLSRGRERGSSAIPDAASAAAPGGRRRACTMPALATSLPQELWASHSHTWV